MSSPLRRGLVLGAAFALLASAMMLPLDLGPRKWPSVAAALANRFCVGVALALARPSLPAALAQRPLLWGAAAGAALSASDAIVTGEYVPILANGAVGGALVSLADARWSARQSRVRSRSA
eukprot:m51a1_g12613 hypothetical protein (121) ;mRNA; f:598-960